MSGYAVITLKGYTIIVIFEQIVCYDQND